MRETTAMRRSLHNDLENSHYYTMQLENSPHSNKVNKNKSCGSAGKESACNVGDLGLIPSLERSPGEGKGYPLQYSGLENSMECIGHGGHKESDTTEQLSHANLKILL